MQLLYCISTYFPNLIKNQNFTDFIFPNGRSNDIEFLYNE